MIFLFALVNLVSSNNSEVTIVLDARNSLEKKESLVLTGPQDLIENVLEHLARHFEYSIMLENPSRVLRVLGKTHNFKLQRVPVHFFELKGYVYEAFGMFNIYYKDLEGYSNIIIDQETYELAVKEMKETPVFYILEEGNIEIERELGLEEYYQANSEQMEEPVKQIFEIVLYEKDVRLDSVSISISAGGGLQFEFLARVLPHCSELLILSLEGGSISPSAARKLGKSLSSLETLIYLDLENTGLDWNSLKKMSESLSKTDVLLSLDLGHNQIELLGAKHLDKLLQKTPNLRKLGLSHSLLTSSSITYLETLSRLPLAILILKGNPIGIEGIVELSSRINTEALEILNLSDCSVNSDISKLASLLSRLSVLEELYLTGNSLGDDGIEDIVHSFPNLPLLRILHLSNTSISEKSVQVLSKSIHLLAHLQELNLSNNNLSPIDEHVLRREQYPSYSFTIQL